MAKLQRKSAKLFAEDAIAAAGGIAQFGSLAEGTPNYSTDPDVIQALDAYKEGWSSAVLGTKSPALEDRNALDYLLSYQQAYIMQRGIPEWLDSETYYIGSVVSNSSQIYISLTDNNTNNALTNTTHWRKFYTPLEIDTLLNNKANISFSNVTDTATSLGAGWGLPSDIYENLTLGATGATYTAPANGYFSMNTSGAANQGYIRMTTGLMAKQDVASFGTAALSVYIPAFKGTVMLLTYQNVGSLINFSFVYAEGSKSEAN